MHATKCLVALALLVLAATASAHPESEYDAEMFENSDIEADPMMADDLEEDYEDEDAEAADLDVDTEQDEDDDEDDSEGSDEDDEGEGDAVADEEESSDEYDDSDEEEQHEIAKKGVAHLNRVRQLKQDAKEQRDLTKEKLRHTEAVLAKAKEAVKKCKKKDASKCPLKRRAVVRLDKKLVVLKKKHDKYARNIRKWVNVSKSYKEMLRKILGKNFKWVHKRSFGPYRYHGHGLKVPHGLFTKKGAKKVKLAPKLKKPTFPKLETNIKRMKTAYKKQTAKVAHLEKSGEATVIPKSVRDALSADPASFAPGAKKENFSSGKKKMGSANPEIAPKKKPFVFRGKNLPKKKGEATHAKP